jgi:hypothetical protein
VCLLAGILLTDLPLIVEVSLALVRTEPDPFTRKLDTDDPSPGQKSKAVVALMALHAARPELQST